MSERKAFSAGMRAAAAVFGYMAATSAWDGLRGWLATRP